MRLHPFLREWRECEKLEKKNETRFRFVFLSETELSTPNLEVLLEMEEDDDSSDMGAAELFVESLPPKTGENKRMNIVWLSEDSFLSNSADIPHVANTKDGRPLVLWFCFRITVARATTSTSCTTTSNDNKSREVNIYYYRLGGAAPSPSPPSSLLLSQDHPAQEQAVKEIDTLLKLLAAHKSVAEMDLYNTSLPLTEPFPVSLHALETYVSSQARSSKNDGVRVLYFGVPLSKEQWQVIIAGCNPNNNNHKSKNHNHKKKCDKKTGKGICNVMLRFCFLHNNWNTGGVALIEALRDKRKCPSKLSLGCSFLGVPETTMHAFLKALEEASPSLEYLSLYGASCTTGDHLAMLLKAISRNKGLTKLNLAQLDRRQSCYSYCPSDKEWEILCRDIIAKPHPTLKEIKFGVWKCLTRSTMIKRDQMLVESVVSSNNTVLCELGYRYAVYDLQAVQKSIEPVLERNRKLNTQGAKIVEWCRRNARLCCCCFCCMRISRKRSSSEHDGSSSIQKGPSSHQKVKMDNCLQTAGPPSVQQVNNEKSSMKRSLSLSSQSTTTTTWTTSSSHDGPFNFSFSGTNK